MLFVVIFTALTFAVKKAGLWEEVKKVREPVPEPIEEGETELHFTTRVLLGRIAKLEGTLREEHEARRSMGMG